VLQEQSHEQGLHKVAQTWSPYAQLSGRTRARLRDVWETLGFDHGLATALRYELDMLLLRTRCNLSRRYRAQVADLQKRRQLLVHLGCGNALLNGWINLDCYPPQQRPGAEILTLDLRRGLPFADGSVAALFTEHFLEHLPFEIVRRCMLPEIRRSLAPGGWLRLAVPDGEYFVDQYVAARAARAEPIFEYNRQGKTPMTMLNDIAHAFGHFFVYDYETLAAILASAGFVAIRRARYADTQVEAFKGRDRNDPWRIAMSLYIEAQAPA
jgi:predicted SAM-dependent methyltransferase